MTDTLSAINIDQLTSSAMNAFTGTIPPAVTGTKAMSMSQTPVHSLTTSTASSRVVLPPILPLIKKSQLKKCPQLIAPKTMDVSDITQTVSSVRPGIDSISQNESSVKAHTNFSAQQPFLSNTNSEHSNLGQQMAISSGQLAGLLQTGKNLTSNPTTVILSTGNQLSLGQIPGIFNTGVLGQSSQISDTGVQVLSPQTSEMLNKALQMQLLQVSGTPAVPPQASQKLLAVPGDLTTGHQISSSQIFSTNSSCNQAQDILNMESYAQKSPSVTVASRIGSTTTNSSVNSDYAKNQLLSSVNEEQSVNSVTNSNIHHLSGLIANTISISAIQQMLDSHLAASITQQVSNADQSHESHTVSESTQVMLPKQSKQSNSQNLSHCHSSSSGMTEKSLSDTGPAAVPQIDTFCNIQQNLSEFAKSVINHPTPDINTPSSHSYQIESLGHLEENQSSNSVKNETLQNSQPIDLSHFGENVHPELSSVESLTDPGCTSQVMVQDLYLARPDSDSVHLDQTATEQNGVGQLQNEEMQSDERAIVCNIQEYLTIQNTTPYISVSEETVSQTVPGIESMLSDHSAMKLSSMKDHQDISGKQHMINSKVIERVLGMTSKQNHSVIMAEAPSTDQSASVLDSTLAAIPLNQQVTGMVENAIFTNQSAVNKIIPANKPEHNLSNGASIFSYYCLECRMSLEEPCRYHVGHEAYPYVTDSPILPYAQASLPSVLYLKQSSTSLQRQTNGVYSKVKISAHTKFGPLIGKFLTSDNQQNNKGHFPVWKIFQHEKEDEIFMLDETVCNWLMYLRPARSVNTQNILAHQLGTEIFFFAVKDILPDEELLFWYSSEYAKVLKVPVLPGQMKISECLLCCQIFRSKKFLTLHEREEHPNESPRQFRCDTCNHKFSSASKLNIHKYSHIGVKPHSCNVCGKRFNDPSNLKAHTAIHTGVKAFTCTKCGKGFRQKAHLQTHMITHTGEKSFFCEYCDKTFARQGDLKTHKYSHTQEKYYNCRICDKFFYKLQNYKRHLLIHSGDRNFMCPLCNKTFYTKYHKERHCKTCKGSGNGFSATNQSNTITDDGNDWNPNSLTVKQIKTS